MMNNNNHKKHTRSTKHSVLEPKNHFDQEEVHWTSDCGITLDEREFQLNEIGEVSPYFSPCRFGDARHFRDLLLKRMVDFYTASGDNNRYLLKILIVHWLQSCLKLYQANEISKGFRESKFKPKFGDRMPFMQSLYNGIKPRQLEQYVNDLNDGPEATKPTKKLLRLVKNLTHDRLIRTEHMSSRAIGKLKSRSDVVFVTSKSSLLSTHLESKHLRGQLIHYGDFFTRAPEKLPNNTKIDQFLFSVLAIIKETFVAKGLQLDETSQIWLRETVFRSAHLVDYHTAKLTNHELPKTVWHVSSGNIWLRILKHAIKARYASNCQIYGHEHGSGSAFLKAEYRTVCDFLDTDRFYTYSSKAAEGLAESVRTEFMMGMPKPDFAALSQTSASSARVGKTVETRKNTVMILPMANDGELCRIVPMPPDIARVDLLGRTLVQLKKWNFDVILKPHPEFPLPISRDFLSQHEVDLELRNFENLDYEPEKILFFTSLTSVFGTAIVNDQDIVLIDMGLETWADRALPELKRSCYLIPAWLGGNNRVEIDWPRLKQALSGPKKTNQSFKEYLDF